MVGGWVEVGGVRVQRTAAGEMRAKTTENRSRCDSLVYTKSD